MTPALTLTGVTKSFGSQQVLAGLDLTIPTGTIFGLIGANGAGKTTTMRLVLGLEKPTSGTIQVFGQPVRFGPTKTNRDIGFLPDVPAFYDEFSAREYLQLCGRIGRVDLRLLPARITALLKRVGLPDTRRRIGGFSRGMKQRLGIAQALIGDPKLLICDEPTSALDPAGRNEFLTLLTQLQGQLTIVLSTHILSDVERVCDQVGILHAGRLQVAGSLADLKHRHAQAAIALSFDDEAQAVAAQDLWPQASLSGATLTVPYTGSYQAAATAVMTTLVAHDLAPLRLQQVAPSLDQVYLEVVGQ